MYSKNNYCIFSNARKEKYPFFHDDSAEDGRRGMAVREAYKGAAAMAITPDSLNTDRRERERASMRLSGGDLSRQSLLSQFLLVMMGSWPPG